ncbi:MAG: hypothetical protein WCJ69_00605 [Betaproteobacteria bacterium]
MRKILEASLIGYDRWFISARRPEARNYENLFAPWKESTPASASASLEVTAKIRLTKERVLIGLSNTFGFTKNV